MKIKKIKDMPAGLQRALMKRGHEPDAEMGIEEALGEWSAWEIGDSYWGTTAAYFYSEFNNT